MEKMLSLTSYNEPHIPQYSNISTPSQLPTHPTQNYNTQSRANQVICNFCNKPNHTWDTCRSRMARDPYRSNNYLNKINYPSQNNQYPYNSYNSRPNYHYNVKYPQRNETQFIVNKPSNNWNPNRNLQFSSTQTYQPNNSQNNYQNFPRHTQNRSDKFCSYCKIAGSHTFDECRNKFRDKSFQNRQNPPVPGNVTKNLAIQFKNLWINALLPPLDEENEQPTKETYYTEN